MMDVILVLDLISTTQMMMEQTVTSVQEQIDFILIMLGMIVTNVPLYSIIPMMMVMTVLNV